MTKTHDKIIKSILATAFVTAAIPILMVISDVYNESKLDTKNKEIKELIDTKMYPKR